MVIQMLVTSIIMSLAVSYLFRQSLKPALQISEDVFELRNPRQNLIIGWIVISLAILLLAGLLFSTAELQSDRYIRIGGIVFFGSLGSAVLLDARCRIILSPTQIESSTPWRGRIIIPWSEIMSVNYKIGPTYFVIRSHSGKRININALMTGMPKLIAHLNQYVEPILVQDAFSRYNKFARKV